MNRHFDKAEGASEEVDIETQSYVFNQTMLRIKDPKISLDFYTRVIGMKLYKKLDFPEMEFTLYFLGMPSRSLYETNIFFAKGNKYLLAFPIKRLFS